MDMFAKYKDPEHRGNIIGFQQRFTAAPITGKYTGAIYSTKPAVQEPAQQESAGDQV